MTLFEASKGRDNNLNLIRLVASIMVIFCHAFPISLGANASDPLYFISKGQSSFGNLAVCIFFFYAGFLITGSVLRSKTWHKFFKKRVLRLFPSLIVVILICAIILGPIFTKLSIVDYFSNFTTYMYLLNIILIPIHNLPGVFTNNIYGQTVNGSLWTLPIEFICYILCISLYKLHFFNKNNMKYMILLFVPIYCLLFSFLSKYQVIREALRPMGMFYVGMLYYIYSDKIMMNYKIAFSAFIILVLSILLGILEYTVLIILPYLLSFIGFAIKKNYHFLDKVPDISYQIYLVAFPIQQIICQEFGGYMNPLVNFIIAIPIRIFTAYILYLYVNKLVLMHYNKSVGTI